MKLSQVFGISPELAARLGDAQVCTVQDLANVADLKQLSERSLVSTDLLEQCQAKARTRIAADRRSRKPIKVLVVVTAILIAVIAAWSYRVYVINQRASRLSITSISETI